MADDIVNCVKAVSNLIVDVLVQRQENLDDILSFLYGESLHWNSDDEW